MSFQNYQLLKPQVSISFEDDTASAGEVDWPKTIAAFLFVQKTHALVSFGYQF